MSSSRMEIVSCFIAVGPREFRFDPGIDVALMFICTELPPFKLESIWGRSCMLFKSFACPNCRQLKPS